MQMVYARSRYILLHRVCKQMIVELTKERFWEQSYCFWAGLAWTKEFLSFAPASNKRPKAVGYAQKVEHKLRIRQATQNSWTRWASALIGRTCWKPSSTQVVWRSFWKPLESVSILRVPMHVVNANAYCSQSVQANDCWTDKRMFLGAKLLLLSWSGVNQIIP